MDPYDYFFSEVEDEAGVSLTDLAPNRTLYVDQFTDEPPLFEVQPWNPKSLKDVFEYYHPVKCVELEDENQKMVSEVFVFAALKDFEDEHLIAQSRLLSMQMEKMEMLRSRLQQNDNTSNNISLREQFINVENTFRNNLQILHDEVRKLEITYRTLDSFFANSGNIAEGSLTLMNVDKEELKLFDSEDTLWVRRELSKYYERLSLRKSYSLLVLPGYLGNSQNVRCWARIAYECKVMMVTDFEDCESFVDLMHQLINEELQGADTILGNVVMTCNYFLGRKKSKFAKDDEALFFPGSAALAGRMTNVKEILISHRVEELNHVSPHGITEIRFHLTEPQKKVLAKLGVVPIVVEAGKTMAYSNRTLYDGNCLVLQEYPFVRLFDWIGKVIQHFSNGEAFCNWNGIVRAKIRNRMHDFLIYHKGPGRLIESYFMEEIALDEYRDMHVSVGIKPFNAPKPFLLQLTCHLSDWGMQWEQKVE
ncbi:MAG: hypothetical protein IKH88_18395 [Prevotella sp.]|nr:hypothetical protein [Prevotella sp.]